MKKRIYLVVLISILILLPFKYKPTISEMNNKITGQNIDIRQALGLNKKEYKQFTGNNVTVAIIDSGIQTHNDLKKTKIILFKDFVNNKIEPYDDFGHGTFISGIIGANGRFKGIAPNVNLAILKVIDKNGMSDSDNLLSALKWILLNGKSYNIKIVNLSLGLDWGDQKEFDLVFKEIKDSGILIITSAGNDGPNAESVMFPGTNLNVLTIGSSNNNKTYKFEDDEVASFSGRGKLENNDTCKPDLITFGVDIKSLDYKNLMGYTVDSGTSYSTAVVSGVAALLMEKYKNFAVNQIIGIIRSHTTFLDGFSTCDQGLGELSF
jgi:serine protease AprX